MQVATRDVELVGGAYRKKFAEEDYPCPAGWTSRSYRRTPRRAC